MKIAVEKKWITSQLIRCPHDELPQNPGWVLNLFIQSQEGVILRGMGAKHAFLHLQMRPKEAESAFQQPWRSASGPYMQLLFV